MTASRSSCRYSLLFCLLPRTDYTVDDDQIDDKSYPVKYHDGRETCVEKGEQNIHHNECHTKTPRYDGVEYPRASRVYLYSCLPNKQADPCAKDKKYELFVLVTNCE